MEKKPPTPMTPFDEWTVPKELHMLKLLLPYTPASFRQMLGILIKVMELQHTVQYFDRQKNLLHEQDFSSGFSSPMKMLEEISPYLPPEQVNMMETFRNMMNIMDMVQMMQSFSDDSGNTDPNQDNTGGTGGFDPMQLVMGMLSPEQKDMFEMYQTMFSRPAESAAGEFSSDGKENFSDHNSTDMEGNADAKQPERDIQNAESKNIDDIERMDTNYE